ncbi:hypothetical protein AMQ83_29825 [Paenibacillus riograndensis]|nr:hypothetical protein AMQ83_29825 [Paenibacillus riograndensis]
MNKRTAILLAAACTVLTGVWAGWPVLKTLPDLFNVMRSFTVTVHNQSDYDIVTVETGIRSGDTRDTFTQGIPGGKTVKITPDLSFVGEGAIYLKYTDSRKETKEVIVCGYTESVSGSSELTILNDDSALKQDCY